MGTVPATTMPHDTRVSILVAEDDVAIGALLRTVFQEEQGWSTTLARSPEAAIARQQQGQFDVLVLDYGLPRMNGLRLLAALRQDPAWSNPCVIVVSALREHLGIRAAVRDGRIHRFVPKPFDLDQLVNAVKELIDGQPPVEHRVRQSDCAKPPSANA